MLVPVKPASLLPLSFTASMHTIPLQLLRQQARSFQWPNPRALFGLYLAACDMTGYTLSLVFNTLLSWYSSPTGLVLLYLLWNISSFKNVLNVGIQGSCSCSPFMLYAIANFIHGEVLAIFNVYTSGLNSRLYIQMTTGHPFRMDHYHIKLCMSKDELIIFPPKPKAFPILGNVDIIQARNHKLSLISQSSLSSQWIPSLTFFEMVSCLHLYLLLTYFMPLNISCEYSIISWLPCLQSLSQIHPSCGPQSDLSKVYDHITS